MIASFDYFTRYDWGATGDVTILVRRIEREIVFRDVQRRMGRTRQMLDEFEAMVAVERYRTFPDHALDAVASLAPCAPRRRSPPRVAPRSWCRAMMAFRGRAHTAARKDRAA